MSACKECQMKLSLGSVLNEFNLNFIKTNFSVIVPEPSKTQDSYN